MICVYVIRNVFNNKFYIGSTKNFHQRKLSHLQTMRRGVHQNCYIQNAFNKYGDNCFVFEIIMKSSLDILNELEYQFIKSLNPQYNLLRHKDNQAYTHSEATREKIRQKATGRKQSLESIRKGVETRSKSESYWESRKEHSKRMKEKHSDGKFGFHTLFGEDREIAIDKIKKERRERFLDIESDAYKNTKPTKVYEIDKDGNLLYEYSSITKTSKETGISKRYIQFVINGKYEKAKGRFFTLRNPVSGEK